MNLANEYHSSVQDMLSKPGLYLCIDTACKHDHVIPLIVECGKVYSINTRTWKVDAELDPNKFYPTAKFRGPLGLGNWVAR
jgi:hypothetical protein